MNSISFKSIGFFLFLGLFLSLNQVNAQEGKAAPKQIDSKKTGTPTGTTTTAPDAPQKAGNPTKAGSSATSMDKVVMGKFVGKEVYQGKGECVQLVLQKGCIDYTVEVLNNPTSSEKLKVEHVCFDKKSAKPLDVCRPGAKGILIRYTKENQNTKLEFQ